MDNFSIIYKILKALEKALDYEEFDKEIISHEKYGISYRRWERIMIMLAKEGYIDNTISPIITLKGLEYLERNSSN